MDQMETLVERLVADPLIAASPTARELAVILCVPTGKSSSGHPYLQEPAWVRFRDWVPHILADGPRTLAAADLVLAQARALGASQELLTPIETATKVLRQVVLTSSITAPPDLWILRQVLGCFSRLGLSRRLLAGEVLHPHRCAPLRPEELRIDLGFLLSRGLLLCAGEGFRIADHRAARAAFETAWPIQVGLPSSLAAAWTRVFSDADRVDGARDTDNADNDEERAALRTLYQAPLPSPQRAAGRFAPCPAEIEIGFRLLPIVLGLRAAGRIPMLLAAGHIDDNALTGDAVLGAVVRDTLRAAGVVDVDGRLGEVGRRVVEKGPGPFGIIEAYHAYLAQLDDTLVKGRGAIWVERGANVAASQDANRHTFEVANDAIDRFCAESGFRYRVFIEHALGKGEATRQRAKRSGPDALHYVGADLEDAAINAAIAERDAGRLPSSMLFVRQADIGRPELLVDALRRAGLDPDGAVMIVGNGFHEVRQQTDERMTAVLAGYASAGIVLVFTEETGLSVEVLLETAWNTYHAGFKYVHERSGQGLRPADKRPPSPLEVGVPLSWSECAGRAGYVRLEAFSVRGRTAYPYTPPSGHNPSISVTHFCVPASLAARLGVA